MRSTCASWVCSGFVALALVIAPGPFGLGPAWAADESIPELERERDRSPGNFQVRDRLANAYYLQARRALDEERYDAYERDLARALDEWVEVLRLRPDAPNPHIMMGIIAAYQGDLDRTLRSLANARKLDPNGWVHYTNIAETMIYRGKPDAARKWLRRAQRLRANPAIIEINYCLAEWYDGNVDDARYHFDEAYHLSPETVNTWNAAPVDDPIRTFNDLTRYCCGDPACGPYMGERCTEQNLEIARRVIPEDVARRELVLEMERRRKLSEIYATRGDLGIEVEEVEEVEQRRSVEVEIDDDAPKTPPPPVRDPLAD